MKKSSYESRQSNIRKLKTPKLEIFKNIYADKSFVVNFEIPEFTCICPKTGLPDFATFYVSYSPDKWCLELKSFKLYLVSFRNIGIFHENVLNKVMDDLIKALKPKSLELKGVFNPRGGIATTVERKYNKK